MTVFAFETITSDEAMGLKAGDTVMVASGSALLTSAQLQSNGTISVTIGERTVLFGAALVDVALDGNLKYPDLSRLLLGGDGDDNLLVTGGLPVAILGGGGDDSLSAFTPQAMVQGAAGDDLLTGIAGSALLGGQGADLLVVVDEPGREGRSFLHGNLGDDTLSGGADGDILLGGQGADVLRGNGGTDTLIGNLGDDYVFGTGDLAGEGGRDWLQVTSDISTRANGGDGDDTVEGGGGDDLLLGGDGHDSIVDYGGFDNLIDGGDGDDLVRVLAGSASIFAGYGADTADGSAADGVFVSGDEGDDVAIGSEADDWLEGGDGADTLEGGGGADILFGGAGADLFLFTEPMDTADLTSLPQIVDWSLGDRIQFAEPVRNLVLTITSPDVESAVVSARSLGATDQIDIVAIQVGADVYLFWQGAENAVILAGRSLNDISNGAFI